MELVQWIVPIEDGSLAVGWAPVWADRLPSLGRLKRPVRRRGAPLVSRWLPCPLAIGALDEAIDDAPIRAALKPGSLTLRLTLVADADPPRPVLPPQADDVRFATIFSELVRVIADLSESAGLPTAGMAPSPERRGLDLSIGALGTLSANQLGDALVLFRVAVETCAQARGVQLTDVRVCLDDGHGEKIAPLDGRIARFFQRDARETR